MPCWLWWYCPFKLWSVVAERSSPLDSSSGVARMWVRIPAWPVAALVSLSKTLNHNCFVLRMECKDVGPVCCVMHVKEPRTYREKERACPCVSGFAPWAPSRVDMCALQILWSSSRLLKLQHFPESGILLRTIRAYWSKRRVVPPVLFRTNYYSIEILHGVTAIILTYHYHHHHHYSLYQIVQL